jgi:hypothetical protein
MKKLKPCVDATQTGQVTVNVRKEAGLAGLESRWRVHPLPDAWRIRRPRISEPDVVHGAGLSPLDR